MQHRAQDTVMPHQIDVFKELLVALRQIVKATDARSKRIARATGLSTTQLLALQAIEGQQTIAAGDLARELGLTQATVTSLLQRLELRGLVQRERDLRDRRRVNVTLTETGKTLLGDSPMALQELLEKRFVELEDWEQLQILSSLQRVARLIDAEDIEAAPVLDTGGLAEAWPQRAPLDSETEPQ